MSVVVEEHHRHYLIHDYIIEMTMGAASTMTIFESRFSGDIIVTMMMMMMMMIWTWRNV